MFAVDEIISTGLKIIDKVLPSPEAKAAAQQKLLELQQNGEIKAEEFAVKREEIAANDRDSARSREKEVKDRMPAILAIVVIVCAFTIIGYVLSGDLILTGEQGLMVGTIIGAVTGYVTQVLNYYFGSSSGSDRKTEIMSRK